ncbi:hypothetical protein AC579_4275 [Pseudocercospora musae]|uniref:Beta-xylanase n=1 Tax=Pseudocercospora musae TaxID=113226 RepID=A0A139IB42_9PEZI|nr:hypothetical protein AC579_4275 [Pseudocercospora musae]
MIFTALLASLLGLGAALVTSPASDDSTTGLAKKMRQKGRSYIGTALTLRSPDDASEQAIVSNKDDFNSITPENAMKWASTEATRDQYNFTQADAHADWAVQHDHQLQCHTLVWHGQLPTWVSSGNFDNATLISIMKSHIDTVAGRYKGKCRRWDVVNEALNENGTYRDTVFYKTIGEAYIPLAFKFAKQADPKAKLYYNDYGLEHGGDKWLGAQRIVKLVKQYGVKINGVGLQAHVSINTTETPSGADSDRETLEKALKGLTALGVEVAYTEIDVAMDTPSTPAKLQIQANTYQRIAASCMAVKGCVGMTTWGVSDKNSWIPHFSPNKGAADMWDEKYQKKPAYYGFLKGIQSGRYHRER